MSQTSNETQTDQDDDVVTVETAGLAQVARPSVVRNPGRIDHAGGLRRTAIGGLRR
jgi:hypothetical protein